MMSKTTMMASAGTFTSVTGGHVAPPLGRRFGTGPGLGHAALACALLLSLVLPGAASARDLQIFLGSRGGTSFSEGYVNHFGHHGFAMPTFGVALELVDDVLLEIAYASNETSGDVFAIYDTRYFAHDAILALRYERSWKPWLRPFARLGGGLLFESFSVKGGGIEAEAEQLGFEIVPSVGVLLLYPTSSLARKDGLFEKWSFGLSFELGYRYARPFDASSMTPSASAEEGEGLEIQRSALDLGRFDTQGLVFGFGLVALF